MKRILTKGLVGMVVMILMSMSAGREQRLDAGGGSGESQRREGTAESLPAGMERSDWKSILAAHEEWKHAIEVDAEKGSGWRAENPGTGLCASFAERGAEVRPEEGDWSWGLELVSYGVGTEQRTMGERRPKVGVGGRRIGYEWDGNLEEWYQNREQGLEHGYTIRERPGREAAPLELRVSVRGGWRQIEVIDEGRGATFGRQPGEAVVRYRGLKVIDAEGREVAAKLEREGEDQLRLIVEEQRASYPLTIDPTISQHAYLKASNTGSNDGFGISVAISGETVVVGASGESSNATGVGGNEADNSASGSGAAYVFVKNGATWSQQAYLKASNTEAGDGFGRSVAISGETVVVGAIGEDSNATGVGGNEADNSASTSGAAYVFVRNGTTWSQQAYLKASNTGASDFFAFSVAISGDTVVVGSSWEDSNATGVNGTNNNSATNSGAAYVFVRNGTTWSQQAYLKASNTGANDNFGRSVSISGETVVVGAYSEASNATGVGGDEANNSLSLAGAAYVFVRNGTTWSQQAYLKASNTGANDYFGQSVAISGETVVVGAIGEASNATGVGGNQADDSAPFSGAAYVFVRNGATWSQQAYLKASNTGLNDNFGQFVAISGDTVVVGANSEASNATGVGGDDANNSLPAAGAAYVFVRNGTTWSQQAYLKASNTGFNDNFGQSVAISGETVVVGAWGEDSNATGVGGNQADNSAGDSGAAYLFATPFAITINGGNSQSAAVGAAVATAPSVIVRDSSNNPVSGVTVTFAVATGGGSVTGGTATTNASGIATVGSWILGSTAGANTLTATSTGLTGSPVTFTATATPATSSVVADVPTVPLQGGEIGPGGTVTIIQILTNPASTPAAVTYVASLPLGMVGVGCSVPFGTCLIGAGTVSGSGGEEIYRTQSVSSPASNPTVTWTGTIPGNSSVTISYLVQVSAVATSGTQYQITTTINGVPGPSGTVTVSAPPAGPGDPVGLVLGQLAGQKSGSVLIYNLYSSGFNPATNDSRISITNTSPSRRAYVHLFFIDGSNCSVADMTVTLTPNQTTSFLASDFDPGVTGYLIAVATDADGCPVIQNDLIGESFVKFESGHRAVLPALGVAALGLGGPMCSPNQTMATLSFDGLSYNPLPRTLAVSGLPSIANGYSTMLVVNRVGGDLGTGAARLGSLFGLLYDDQEVSQSFTLAGNVCQLRGVLGNNFPRTSPRYTTVIPAGRSGWMKFWSAEDQAITGAVIQEAQDRLAGGHNLHHLTTTSSATLTIPVIPAW